MAKPVRSGHITCARCGSRVRGSIEKIRMFCSNPECALSEEKEMEAELWLKS